MSETRESTAPSLVSGLLDERWQKASELCATAYGDGSFASPLRKYWQDPHSFRKNPGLRSLYKHMQQAQSSNPELIETRVSACIEAGISFEEILKAEAYSMSIIDCDSDEESKLIQKLHETINNNGSLDKQPTEKQITDFSAEFSEYVEERMVEDGESAEDRSAMFSKLLLNPDRITDDPIMYQQWVRWARWHEQESRKLARMEDDCVTAQLCGNYGIDYSTFVEHHEAGVYKVLEHAPREVGDRTRRPVTEDDE